MVSKFGSKKGWVEIGGKRYFMKSAWERNYCRFLQWQKEKGLIYDWHYEPETFWFHEIKRGTRSYLPDFKVINMDHTHEWHEVKGFMTPKSKTQIRRFAKYYPDEKLTIISKAVYKRLSDYLFRMIPNWEE